MLNINPSGLYLIWADIFINCIFCNHYFIIIIIKIFINPIIIGTKTDSNANGSISVVIPNNLVLNKNYKIRIKCTSDSFINSTSFVIKIVGFNTPVISTTKDSICDGTKALFTVSPNNPNLNFTWIKNNILISGATNNNLYADSSGFYRAVINSNGCSDTSNTFKLSVLPNPKVGFTINNPIQCINGNNFLFSDTSSITSGTLTRKWNFGTGINDNSIIANPIKVFSNSDTYSIKMIVSSNFGCKDSVTKSVIVNPNPKIGFTINNPVQCLNKNNFLFNDTSSIALGTFTRKWNLGAGVNDTSMLANPTKVYSIANTYIIKLVAVSNNGCIDSLTKNITVDDSLIIQRITTTDSLNLCGYNAKFLIGVTTNYNGIKNYLW
jgi:hypothetical protein